MKLRTVIIFGVILLILFSCSIGFRNNGDKTISLDSIKDASWRKSLDNLMTRKLSASDIAGDLKGNCFIRQKTLVFAAAGDCSIVFASTIPLNRRLTFSIRSEDSLSFKFTPGDPDTQLPDPSSVTDQGVTTVTIDIFKEGGTLTITCNSTSKKNTAIPTIAPTITVTPAPTVPPEVCILSVVS